MRIKYVINQLLQNYTERQKKLITSLERRALKSTASKLIIVRHR